MLLTGTKYQVRTHARDFKIHTSKLQREVIFFSRMSQQNPPMVKNMYNFNRKLKRHYLCSLLRNITATLKGQVYW